MHKSIKINKTQLKHYITAATVYFSHCTIAVCIMCHSYKNVREPDLGLLFHWQEFSVFFTRALNAHTHTHARTHTHTHTHREAAESAEAVQLLFRGTVAGSRGGAIQMFFIFLPQSET